MTRIEPMISGVGSDRSSNYATTTANVQSMLPLTGLDLGFCWKLSLSACLLCPALSI